MHIDTDFLIGMKFRENKPQNATASGELATTTGDLAGACLHAVKGWFLYATESRL
jgi:hypothetical protein